tara:strand:- start:10293 stop:11096 length:804 start_codon:yes stop_codon:yes gene_type:complete
MKNIIFIPYIKREKNVTAQSSIGHSNRHQGYEYGINSWKAWAEKNGHEVYIMSELLCPESHMLITWQRWRVLDILEHNQIEYDQVLVVDADSIVHPNCPDFFELTNNQFTSVLTDGDYEWVNRAINGYSKMFWNKGFCIPSYEFFQTGFVIISKKHKWFFDKVFDFYEKNRKKIIESYDILLTGSDIALINCMRKEFNLELNLLPRQFGMMDMVRKNLFYHHPKCYWEDSLTNLYNSGWVYQFNAIPHNDMGRDRTYWMKRVYEELF